MAKRIVGWALVHARAQNDPRSQHGAWKRPVARDCRHPRNRRSWRGEPVCLDCGAVLS